tara:strand:+ start:5090 stop:6055 length:966 start_codon:yes stop_codon:yes gene_type:complete
MAYTINKSDGTVVTTVNDGTLNTDTSIQLIGRNYEGYGEAFNENLIKLMENFSNSTNPLNAIEGQLWFDATNDALTVYDGSNFDVPNPSRRSVSAPTSSLNKGVLWFDTGNNDLFVYNGTSFINVMLTDQLLDEDDLVSNSATQAASQQSLKAYIDAQNAEQDLDFAGDSGTSNVLVDSQTFTIAGGDSITTAGSGQTLTIDLDENITVNQISSTDSTSVTINDNLNVEGTIRSSGVIRTETLDVNTIQSTDSSGINFNEDAIYVSGDRVLTSASLPADSVDTVQIVDDAVSRAKLKDEVSLQIISSDGSTVVKTIFGAGS